MEDAEKIWGNSAKPTPRPDDETTALAVQLGDMAKLLSDAKNAEAEARERAARAEAESEHLRERLAELRDNTDNRRRWRWRKQNS